MNDLTNQIKFVNEQRDLEACKGAVRALFIASKLGVKRKKGTSLSPLDEAIKTCDDMSDINELKRFAFNTVMKGEGLGVI